MAPMAGRQGQPPAGGRGRGAANEVEVGGAYLLLLLSVYILRNDRPIPR